MCTWPSPDVVGLHCIRQRSGDAWSRGGSGYFKRCLVSAGLGCQEAENLSRALELYEQAAGRNDTEGATGLAWMHEHGEGSAERARKRHPGTAAVLAGRGGGTGSSSYAAAPSSVVLLAEAAAASRQHTWAQTSGLA